MKINRIRKIQLLFAVAIASVASSCSAPTTTQTEVMRSGSTDGITASIAKWKDNRKSAITITNDAGRCNFPQEIRNQEIVDSFGLNMTYEFVTTLQLPECIQILKSKKSLSWFGHGNEHSNHDRISLDSCRSSMKRNYQSLVDNGMEPIAFGCPYGAGRNLTTQKICKEVGFLASRQFTCNFDPETSPHIMPGDNWAPDNWFFLPTIRMEALAFENESRWCEGKELTPILDESQRLQSWLILTYHSIGDEKGWGYTKLDDFVQNLSDISKRDIWCGSFNDITKYCYERNAAHVYAEKVDSSIAVTVIDLLENNKFNLPLTIFVKSDSFRVGQTYEITHDEDTVTQKVVSKGELMVDLLPDEQPYLFTLKL